MNINQLKVAYSEIQTFEQLQIFRKYAAQLFSEGKDKHDKR
jgi:hypothetical protein